jgi:shikimate kinase
MNIVLIGYRGTGKSVVARLLAKELKRKLMSVDDLIVRLAGIPIPGIVSEYGWPRFREMEAQIVAELTAKEDNAVIDCGGGVVLDARNVQNLRRNGKTVLLTADFDVILKRIRRDPNRPPLKEGLSFADEQRQILAERKEKYESSADFTCDTTSADPRETSGEIIKYFRQKAWI